MSIATRAARSVKLRRSGIKGIVQTCAALAECREPKKPRVFLARFPSKLI